MEPGVRLGTKEWLPEAVRGTAGQMSAAELRGAQGKEGLSLLAWQLEDLDRFDQALKAMQSTIDSVCELLLLDGRLGSALAGGLARAAWKNVPVPNDPYGGRNEADQMTWDHWNETQKVGGIRDEQYDQSIDPETSRKDGKWLVHCQPSRAVVFTPESVFERAVRINLCIGLSRLQWIGSEETACA
jgi:hypothetical protein